MDYSESKLAVLAFLDALNRDDFEEAKTYLNDGFKFRGPLGKRDGADSYMQDMQKMKFKYKINKAFADGEDVCVIYDIDMSGNATISTCGLYHLTNGMIDSLHVLFDPRPLLSK